MGESVKNLRGTANLTCSCGTWLKHWEHGTGRAAAVCLVQGCRSRAEVGAHVKLVNSVLAGSMAFIVPMCQSHNMSDENLTLSDGNHLVLANKQKTCG